MIREIKIKKRKFGTILASFVEGYNTPEDAANLESMNAFSAFVTIHTLGKTREVANGVTYVNQRTGPKVKQAIGHHISQIRGDQILALVSPSVRFTEDITRVYDFADANRMERAYGFFLGNPDKPSVVALTGSVVPHLFHALPDQMDMVGEDWIQWVHKWAPRAMMTHRYFDANSYCHVISDRAIGPDETVHGNWSAGRPDPAAEAISLVEATPPLAQPESPVKAPETAPAPVLKRKPGRPKKK